MPSSFLEVGLEAEKRWQELIVGERPWIRIGTALCGEAAGAFEVAGAVEAELASQGVSAEVSRVGCLGLCFAEPLLDVQLPGGHRIFYGNVSTGDVAEIVSSMCQAVCQSQPRRWVISPKKTATHRFRTASPT